MKCPYCGSEVIEKYEAQECGNVRCGGYFYLVPVWEWNKAWGTEPEQKF